MYLRKEEAELDRHDPVVVRRETVEPAVPLEHDHDDVATARRMAFPSWSPVQLLALVIGIPAIVFGGMALAQAGAGGPTTHVDLAGLHHTQWLGYLHLGFGAMMVLAAIAPGFGRGLMVLLGAVALAFGIITLVQHSAMHDALGVHQVHGVIYTIAGAVSILVGFFAPIVSGAQYARRRTHTAA